MHVDGFRDVQDLRERFCFRLDRVEHSIEELVIMLCDRRYRKQEEGLIAGAAISAVVRAEGEKVPKDPSRS